MTATPRKLETRRWRLVLGWCLLLIAFNSASHLQAQAEDFVHIGVSTVVEGTMGSPNFAFVEVSVERNKAALDQQPVDVSYVLTPGTADFTDVVGATPSTMVSIPTSGPQSQTIAVEIVQDDQWESDEYLTLTVVSIVGAAAGNINGQILIQDDDPGRVTITSPEQLEGDIGSSNQLGFNIELANGPAPRPFTIDYIVQNGTAQAGIDYAIPPPPHSATLLFGDTQRLIPIDIIPNELPDGDRTVMLVPSTSDPDIDLLTAIATGLIKDDEAPVSNVFVDFGIVSPSLPIEGKRGFHPGIGRAPA